MGRHARRFSDRDFGCKKKDFSFRACNWNRVIVKERSMKKNGSLESKMLALKRGESVEVQTPQERAAAHRISIRCGLSIVTRANLFGKGYQIVRN